MRTLIALLSLALLSSCAAPEAEDGPPTGAAPLIGKSPDGITTDAADRGCGVVLRTFERKPDGKGGFVVKNGYWTWVATVDVKKSLVATAEVLYRPALSGSFYVFKGKVATGGSGDYQRYTVEVNSNTTPTPSMDQRSWEFQNGELAVYAHTSANRLFDHNRNTNDFDNYKLTPSNSFTIADAPGTCPAEKPKSQLTFGVSGPPVQHGAIVAGGSVTLAYPIERMTTCRYSSAGAQLWDIEANIKFEPSGTLLQRSVTQVTSPGGQGATRVAAPLTFDVPAGTQRIQAWFHNFNGGGGCDDWDSLAGANYQISVTGLPPAPSWAGDWGNGFSRACSHIDGLAEPVVIDEYTRERSCMFIDADLYVPGFTDQSSTATEQYWAQAVFTYDSGTPQYAWLEPQGRVGNNQRYRWTLPYEMRMASRSFTTAHFSFRFSNDGVHFFQIGQSDGPAGGTARSLTETAQ